MSHSSTYSNCSTIVACAKNQRCYSRAVVVYETNFYILVGASCIAVDMMVEEASDRKKKGREKVAFRPRPVSGLVSKAC